MKVNRVVDDELGGDRGEEGEPERERPARVQHCPASSMRHRAGRRRTVPSPGMPLRLAVGLNAPRARTAVHAPRGPVEGLHEGGNPIRGPQRRQTSAPKVSAELPVADRPHTELRRRQERAPQEVLWMRCSNGSVRVSIQEISNTHLSGNARHQEVGYLPYSRLIKRCGDRRRATFRQKAVSLADSTPLRARPSGTGSAANAAGTCEDGLRPASVNDESGASPEYRGQDPGNRE